MKDLRIKTVQPEAYLKEVLGDIGTFHKNGPNTNMWSLKPEYMATVMSGGQRAAMAASGSGEASGSGAAKMEEDEDGEDDDDDDDDDDMEEIGPS